MFYQKNVLHTYKKRKKEIQTNNRPEKSKKNYKIQLKNVIIKINASVKMFRLHPKRKFNLVFQ